MHHALRLYLLLHLHPLFFVSVSPNKCLVHIVPRWCLLLRRPKLTNTHFLPLCIYFYSSCKIEFKYNSSAILQLIIWEQLFFSSDTSYPLIPLFMVFYSFKSVWVWAVWTHSGSGCCARRPMCGGSWGAQGWASPASADLGGLWVDSGLSGQPARLRLWRTE